MADSAFPPNYAKQLKDQNTFSTREVGVTHPDTPSFIRLTDQGDIQIMADDGLGIIISYKYKSITLMAPTIRFMTTDNEGLAWNNLFFNSNATTYTQAALNPATGVNITNVFANAANYFNNSTTTATTFAATEQTAGGNTANPIAPSQDLSTVTPTQTSPASDVNANVTPPDSNSTPPPLEN